MGRPVYDEAMMEEHGQSGAPHLLNLPIELRQMIFEYVFDDDAGTKFMTTAGIVLEDKYRANEQLQPLLACRQLYLENRHLALNKIHFVVANPFARIPDRLSLLQPSQIASVRHLTVVTDKRHFLALDKWGATPLGAQSDLHLDTLTIALYRSNAWHYLFDSTETLVRALRVLRGTKRIVFVRNGALVKGGLRAWYNRLVGLMMKVEHSEMFLACPPTAGRIEELRERVSWRWTFDERQQSFDLFVVPSPVGMDEMSYLESMKPYVDDLNDSLGLEDWNPDPRSRRLYP